VDVGQGAIGGYVTSFTKEGEIAAEDADRILNGDKAKDIPIVRGANAYIFDLRALKRWGLKEADVPPGSTLLNRQPSLWESFRWYVIGGMTLILVEALLISGLLWQRIRRKAAETKLIIANKELADDITERKLAQEALAGMSRKLLDAQEQERARIGRELHDDINQQLALLSVEIDGMKEVSPVTNGELRSRMDELGKRTSEISAVVQSLSHELHSSKLEYLGLVLAMKGFCKEFGENHKVEVAFASEGMPPIVPSDISLCLFRVMQEGLHNALKHSGVKLFDVMLLGSPAEIRLTVRDLGKGFDPELAKDTPGLGLVSMQERVRLVKGTISISSRPLSGTEINVRVPLQAGVQTEQSKTAGA
jgi:signal transduction histidine kinase